LVFKCKSWPSSSLISFLLFSFFILTSIFFDNLLVSPCVTTTIATAILQGRLHQNESFSHWLILSVFAKKNGVLREWDYVKEHDEYVLWHSFILPSLPAIRLIIQGYPGGVSGVRESQNNRKICKVFFSLLIVFPINFPLPLLTAPGLPRMTNISSLSIYFSHYERLHGSLKRIQKCKQTSLIADYMYLSLHL